MSDRKSTSPPSRCSGLMYAGVPTTLAPAEIVVAIGLDQAATPKSTSFGLPEASIRTLPGLRSR
jgi:hypothetical protein